MGLKPGYRCRQVIMMRQVRLKSWKLAIMALRWKLDLMRYLLDIAGQVSSEMVELLSQIQDHQSGSGAGDEASLFVLMPMRV